jgi:hypothetical protein
LQFPKNLVVDGIEKTKNIMKFNHYLVAICVIAFTGISAQDQGSVTFKNGEVKKGLIENKGSQILFYENEGDEPKKIPHEDIEHIKTGDIEYFRDSPKAKKLQEYQVLVNGGTKLVARHFKTNYGKMERKYFSSNGISPYYSPNSTPIQTRGPRSNGTIIRYYIKKSDFEHVEKVYRLVVGDVDWLGYKKAVKKLLGDCEALVQKVKDGGFKDDEYGKEAELEAIVHYYNENCASTSSSK